MARRIVLRKFDARQCRVAKSVSTARCDCLARSKPMLDLILVATVLVFFAVSIGYAYACDRL
jgi:hypothetical protein